MNMFLLVDLVDLPTISQPREKSHRATYPGNAHLQVISLQM